MTAQKEIDYFRRRAEAEMAIAQAAGAQKTTASPDYRTVFVQRRDGTTETIRLNNPNRR